MYISILKSQRILVEKKPFKFPTISQIHVSIGFFVCFLFVFLVASINIVRNSNWGMLLREAEKN